MYFYNSATQESSWEHPLDGHYRELVAYWRDAYARGERPRESSKNVHHPFGAPMGLGGGVVRAAHAEEVPLNQTFGRIAPRR